MRKTVMLLAALLIAAVERGAAQDSVNHDVKLANGTVIVRKCAEWKSEGILVLPTGGHDPGPAGLEYLKRLGMIMERRMTHVAADSVVLAATYTARVTRSGATVDMRQIKGSGRGGFDMDAQRVMTFLPNDPMSEPTPETMPDSFPIFVIFGRNRDGSLNLVSHVACNATPYPNNQAPVFPLAATLSRTKNTVVAKYTVDISGTVDTTGVEIIESPADAFEEAAMEYLSNLKYLPMEFDGRTEKQVLTRSIVFNPPVQDTTSTH
jgi:hypothetical protein